MNKENVATATEWFMLLYLPLIPLGRYRVRFHASGDYEILSKEPFNFGEMARTVLYAWVAFPTLLAEPLVLGYILHKFFPSFTLFMITIIFWFIWVIAVATRQTLRYAEQRTPKIEG